MNAGLLVLSGIDVQFLASDQISANIAKLKDIGVSAGDGVFVLGFPMGLAGEQRNYVIVRSGSIARIGDLLDSVVPDLLIDSHVFPGNSGGPVFLEPTDFAINGTKRNNTSYLIGVCWDISPIRTSR